MIYIKDGKFAGNHLLIDGRIVVNPTEEQWLSAGYSRWEPEEVSEETEKTSVSGTLTEEETDGTEKAKVYSKLKIATLLAKGGKWTAFKNAMAEYVLFEGFTMLEAWETAQNLSEDDASFQAGIQLAKDLGMTDEQVSSGLAECLAE